MTARIVALDVGIKTIGVAVSDESFTIAVPLTTIARKQSIYDDLDRLKIVLQPYWPPAVIVIGWPISLDGTETKMTSIVKGFEKRLTASFNGIPLVRQDERFSTDEAVEYIRHKRGTIKSKKRKGTLDAVAAAVILTRFLESPEKQNMFNL